MITSGERIYIKGKTEHAKRTDICSSLRRSYNGSIIHCLLTVRAMTILDPSPTPHLQKIFLSDSDYKQEGGGGIGG